MTREKLQDLRHRMMHHTVICDTAVVILTAKELQELIDTAEKLIELKAQLKEEAEFPSTGRCGID